MSDIKHMKRLGGKTVVAEFQEFEDSSNLPDDRLPREGRAGQLDAGVRRVGCGP